MVVLNAAYAMSKTPTRSKTRGDFFFAKVPIASGRLQGRSSQAGEGGSKGSGGTSAIIFTLVESAKRHGFEPHAYLRELLHRLPQTNNQEIAQLTPKAMAKNRARKR